jgi:hypothetical protein
MSAAWREAAGRLDIEVVAPFEVEGVSSLAYLPSFGGPEGMVIARLSTVTEAQASVAAKAGWYLSRVSDEYADFDGSRFQAALDDWGWFGPDESRPDWYTGTAWTN